LGSFLTAIALITAITVFAVLAVALLIEIIPVIIACIVEIVLNYSLLAEAVLLANEDIYLFWLAFKAYNNMSPQTDSLLPEDEQWFAYLMFMLMLAG